MIDILPYIAPCFFVDAIHTTMLVQCIAAIFKYMAKLVLSIQKQVGSGVRCPNKSVDALSHIELFQLTFTTEE
jgi:phage-related holin